MSVDDLQFASVCILAIAVVLVSCDFLPFGGVDGNGGGEGADFDATLYYTITQADLAIANAINDAIDTEIYQMIGSMVDEADWADRIQIPDTSTSDPATQYQTMSVPAETDVAVVKIEWYGALTPSDVVVYISNGTPTSPDATKTQASATGDPDSVLVLVDIQTATTLYGWTEFSGGGTLGAPVVIFPITYIRGVPTMS